MRLLIDGEARNDANDYGYHHLLNISIFFKTIANKIKLNTN